MCLAEDPRVTPVSALQFCTFLQIETRFYRGIFLQIICQALLNVSLLRSRFEVYLSSTFKRVFVQSLFSSIDVFVTSVDFKERVSYNELLFCYDCLWWTTVSDRNLMLYSLLNCLKTSSCVCHGESRGVFVESDGVGGKSWECWYFYTGLSILMH